MTTRRPINAGDGRAGDRRMVSIDVGQVRSSGFALVGRGRELDALVGALTDLPAVVLLEGEAGAGKSRLIREAGALLSVKGGPRVATGLCHPLREPLPFGPVLQALGAAVRWLPANTTLPSQAIPLVLLLPGLEQFMGDYRPSEDASFHRARLALAVRTVLEAVPGDIVLVMEDMHWADDATRELLFLIARDPPENVGLVFTYRPQDLPRAQPLLGKAYRRPLGVSGTDIALTPLTEADIAQLVEGVVGPVFSQRLPRALHRRSGGLPLVVEEDLLTLCERHAQPGPHPVEQDLAALAASPAPRSLQEAVHERLAGLPAAAIRVVEAAAVLGLPAEEEVLARIAEVDEEESASAVTDALRVSLLHEAEPGAYAFRHVLAQQAIYDQLPGPRRRALHKRAHRVLREQAHPPLVHLAHHSKALGATETWLREAEEAAREAAAVGDDGVATQLFTAILKEPKADPGLRSRTVLALAEIAHKATDYLASLELLRRFIEDPALDTESRGRVRLRLSGILMNHAGDPRGIDELRTAVQELEPWPHLRIHAMVPLIIDERTQTPREIDQWIERAEHITRGTDDEVVQATLEGARLLLLSRRGDPSVYERLEAMDGHSPDPEVRRQRWVALYNVGVHAIHRGEDARGEALMKELVRHTENGVNPSLECYARCQLLQLAWHRGQWEGLEDRFKRMEAAFPNICAVEVVQALVLGSLACSRGQWTAAMEHLTTAVTAAERNSEVAQSLRAAAALTELQLARDETQAAWKTAEPAVGLLRHAATWPRTLGLLSAAVEAALACGLNEEAERLTGEAEDNRHDRVAPAADAELLTSQGLVLRERAPDLAVERFLASRDAYQLIRRPYPAARAVELAALATAASQPDTSRAFLRQACDTYSTLGATFDLARCERTLRRYGPARSSRGRRGYGDALSPREMDVATLLAAQATNRDIAHALCLSVRTVEHHVSRTLQKLRVSQREAVAAALAAYKENNPAGSGRT
ncbi:AAA family ATPase [Streptomyces sp. ISL-22]|uniref:ATP-binding protein n=1 Tax=unclassified Streptomyces TaxID=2593676 RepID=UPI001BEA6E82|nr:MULTISPECIES: AAA family ATPase [unclassified Streptomyces]MBT2418881.1 AAA family ATPase [Streptomyces sp. ISL-24]MBT2435686.1 AAA family ATPase [Streptomyces sp. ISL-22]